MSPTPSFADRSEPFEPRPLAPAVSGDRDGLRRYLRAERRAISSEHRARCNAAVCANALRFERVLRAPVVALYRACDGEADPLSIADAVRARGAQVAWARISDDEAAGLEFVRADGWNTVRGVPSPIGPVVALGADHVVVVPGVGFDLRGGRLGRGSGHYDRYLAHNPVPTLGLAFGCQVVQALPLAAHDRPVSALATEHRLWVFAETSEDEV